MVEWRATVAVRDTYWLEKEDMNSGQEMWRAMVTPTSLLTLFSSFAMLLYFPFITICSEKNFITWNSQMYYSCNSYVVGTYRTPHSNNLARSGYSYFIYIFISVLQIVCFAFYLNKNSLINSSCRLGVDRSQLYYTKIGFMKNSLIQWRRVDRMLRTCKIAPSRTEPLDEFTKSSQFYIAAWRAFHN